jgi:hypothetical protein
MSARMLMLLLWLLNLHAMAIFVVSMLLFVSKWFPYGPLMVSLRTWLYSVF